MQYRFTKDFGTRNAGEVIDGRYLFEVSSHDLFLAGILEEVKEEEWPKVGDKVWRFNHYGGTFSVPYVESDLDEKYIMGNHRTKEEAEKARDDVREFIRNRK